MSVALALRPPSIELVIDPVLEGPLRALAIRQVGLLTLRQLREHGVNRAPVRTRVNRKRWRAVTRGVVDVGAVPPVRLPPQVRAKRSAILGLVTFGPGAIAVGLSALTLLGVWGVPPGAPPQVSRPDASGRTTRDGITCRRFDPGEPVLIDGWLVTAPVLALAQAAVDVDPRTALGLLDSALHRGVITADEITAVVSRVRGRRGSRRIASVWPLIDGRRESPLESWAYYDLVAAGLVPTDVQVKVHDRLGRVIARADVGFYLEDEATWLFVELDGREFHGLDDRPADDERDNMMTFSHGGATVRYRSQHLGPRGRMIGELGAHLRGRRWRPPASSS